MLHPGKGEQLGASMNPSTVTIGIFSGTSVTQTTLYVSQMERKNKKKNFQKLHIYMCVCNIMYTSRYYYIINVIYISYNSYV